MKNFGLILIAFLLLGSCNKNEQFVSPDDMVNKALKSVKLITAEELHELMETYEVYTLVDVRQELEFYHGYIPGTVNIPRGVLEFSIADEVFWNETGLYQPQPEERIVLYCLKGQRSALAAESLKKLGYNNVYVLEGGWKKWELSFPDIFEKDLEKLSGKNDKPVKSGSC